MVTAPRQNWLPTCLQNEGMGAACDNPKDEIIALFRQLDLPEQVAQKLVDPDGDFAFSNLEEFVRLVTVDVLREAGLKASVALKLMNDELKPGGGTHTLLVARGPCSNIK